MRDGQAAVRAEKKRQEEKIREDFLEEVMPKPRPEERAGGRQVRTEGRDMPGKGAMVGTTKQVQRPPAGQAQRIVQLTPKRACESRGGSRARAHRPRAQAEHFRVAQALLTPRFHRVPALPGAVTDKHDDRNQENKNIPIYCVPGHVLGVLSKLLG